jgi:hypothetical protein
LPDALSEYRKAVESGFGARITAVQQTAGRFNEFNGIINGLNNQTTAA